MCPMKHHWADGVQYGKRWGPGEPLGHQSLEGVLKDEKAAARGVEAKGCRVEGTLPEPAGELCQFNVMILKMVAGTRLIRHLTVRLQKFRLYFGSH